MPKSRALVLLLALAPAPALPADAEGRIRGKVLDQLNGITLPGVPIEVEGLATAFTDKLNRRMAQPMTGKPPADAPPIVSNSQNKPVKKILHIREH